MIRNIFLVTCLTSCLAAFIGCAAAADKMAAEDHEKIVRNYVAAFNAHDTEAMLKMVTDDVQWLSIDGDTITTETNTKEELRHGMTDYFESCPSCQSQLTQIFTTGTRVSALEVASYDTKNGRQEQQSVSLYEFSGSLIQRVYYFPAEE